MNNNGIGSSSKDKSAKKTKNQKQNLKTPKSGKGTPRRNRPDLMDDVSDGIKADIPFHNNSSKVSRKFSSTLAQQQNFQGNSSEKDWMNTAGHAEIYDEEGLIPQMMQSKQRNKNAAWYKPLRPTKANHQIPGMSNGSRTGSGQYQYNSHGSHPNKFLQNYSMSKSKPRNGGYPGGYQERNPKGGVSQSNKSLSKNVSSSKRPSNSAGNIIGDYAVMGNGRKTHKSNGSKKKLHN
jgi:hypothetical protein